MSYLLIDAFLKDEPMPFVIVDQDTNRVVVACKEREIAERVLEALNR